MSLSFNNPLIIGDINAPIKKEIGNLDDLQTADKSSLVNALNDALDSTLNGANTGLSNLSDTGNARLHALKAYADNGELLTDSEGLADVKNYAHSTFDRSKFTVVGSPNITNDGIATAFASGSYLTADKTIIISSTGIFDIELKINIPSSTTVNETFVNIGDGSSTYKDILIRYSYSNNRLQFTVNNYSTSSTIWTAYWDDASSGLHDIKYGYDGTKYYIYVDGSLIDKKTTTTKYNAGTYNIYIGNRVSQATQNYLANGYIDLKYLSISADGVPVFSGNKTGIDTIKPDDYTVVGTPTISADCILTASANNCVTFPIIDFTKKWEIQIPAFINSFNSLSYICSAVGNQCFNIGIDIDKKVSLYLSSSGTNWSIRSGGKSSQLLAEKTWTTFAVGWDGEYYYTIINGVRDNVVTSSTALYDGNTQMAIGTARTLDSAADCSIDLNSFKVYVDGDLVYQPCLKIPYTESKTGSKVVNAVYRDRVNDMADQFGYANYYTLDEDNGNFTLPQVEQYGLIARQNFAPSNKYKELTLGASGDTYVAPADGYFFLKKAVNGSNQNCVMRNTVTEMASIGWHSGSSAYLRTALEVGKNDVVEITYTAGGTTNYFRFVYAKGSESEAS